MPTEWTRHDDSTYFVVLGGVLTVAITYEQIGEPGWKIQVGKRAMRDKISKQEDAQKVALAFAHRILTQCGKDLESLVTSLRQEQGDAD